METRPQCQGDIDFNNGEFVLHFLQTWLHDIQKKRKKKNKASFLEVSPKSYRNQNITNTANLVMHNSITENLPIHFAISFTIDIIFNVT